MLDSLAAIKALPSAVYTTDAEGTITFFNEAAAELWGHRPRIGEDKWCGSWKLYWPDGRPLPHDECPMAVCLKEGRAVRGVSAILERPDGKRIPFEPYPTPLFDSDGKLVGALNMLIDVSDKSARDVDTARLAAIVTSSEDAIISKTLQSVVTSWNVAAERIFGYSEQEMVGQSILRVIPEELRGEEEEILAKLRRGERVTHFETVRMRKDGTRIDVSLSVSPVLDRSGRVVGAAKVARDITARKEAERLQSALIHELDHRVRNTLATVQAIAGQSMHHARSSSEFVDSFNGRIQALAKAHGLLTEHRVESAALDEVVRAQVCLGTDDSRVSISGPAVSLDIRETIHISMILHELATNARKYGALSVPQGRLAIAWSIKTADPQLALAVSWREEGGPPVSAPARRGFGSTLIQQMAESLSGHATLEFHQAGFICSIEVLVKNEPGGRRFPTAPAGERSMNNSLAAAAKSARRVLVIEDEPLVALDIKETLTRAGHHVVGPGCTLRSANELLGRGGFDLAIVDVNLGEEDGGEIATRLAERGIPFAFVTGYGRTALREGLRDAPLLRKPFSEADLLSTVETLSQRAGLSGGLRVVPLRSRGEA